MDKSRYFIIFLNLLLMLMINGCISSNPTPTPVSDLTTATCSPPTVTITSSIPTEVLPGERLALSTRTSGTDIKYLWSATAGTFSTEDAPSAIYTVPEEPGPVTITISVANVCDNNTDTVDFLVIAPATSTPQPIQPTQTSISSPTSTPIPTNTAVVEVSSPTPALININTPVSSQSNEATASQSATIFASAADTSEPLAIVFEGELVDVLGKSFNSDFWWYVKNVDNVFGFVASDRFEWNGDVSSLPPVAGPTSTPTRQPSRELSLDLYPLSGVENEWCANGRWFRNVYIKGRGGDGNYTYFWNEAQISEERSGEHIFTVSGPEGNRIGGKGMVGSAGKFFDKEIILDPVACDD